ncbi:MAG: hypothetical protein NTW16_11975, partial [Bacteroidetes bacterium]|nr:hypothetical protein [Bacteroidota bacterium]
SIYPLILTGSVSLQIDGQLIKIDQHKVEYLLVNLFIAVQSSIQQSKNYYQAIGIQVDDFFKKLQDFPGNVVPPYRKKREYWLAILAKHEIHGNNPYNKKLFERIERGVYVLNPYMQVRCIDSWILVSQMINSHGISLEDMISHSVEKHTKEMEENRINWEKQRKKFEREELLRKQRNDRYRGIH